MVDNDYDLNLYQIYMESGASEAGGRVRRKQGTKWHWPPHF